jgi:indolepyruvate ferredoxin oxidoreductase beta subunit
MDRFSIYVTGVGGQGIGLLSEALLRAGDHAGLTVKGVDTHGLAQRGGIVVSRLRFGASAHSPLIPRNGADLAVSLERTEALRAVNVGLRDGGDLIYYNTAWQPLAVRLGDAGAVGEATVADVCRRRGIREFRIFKTDLEDVRMQNVVVLAHIDKNRLVPGVGTDHYRAAMTDLLRGGLLEKNLALFDQERTDAA